MKLNRKELDMIDSGLVMYANFFGSMQYNPAFTKEETEKIIAIHSEAVKLLHRIRVSKAHLRK